MEYSKREIKTTTIVQNPDYLEFPAITVCNLNQVKQSIRNCIPGHDLSYFFHHMSEIKTYTPELFQNMSLSANITGEDLIGCFKNHTLKLEETIIFCSWVGRVQHCGELFIPRPTEYGQCFTFNGNAEEPSKTSYFQGPFSGLSILVDIQTSENFFARTLQTGIKV